MSKVVSDIAISADGYAAGPNQRLEAPLGDVDEDRLHGWLFSAGDEHRAEVDAILDAGAFIMGRNMFGPDRGEPDPHWRGWWGDDPPYHRPVFVLTHYAREPLQMEGGTTFTFVTDGIHSALAQARAAAEGRNVAIGGGPSTLNQFLAAGLVDELRLHIIPTVIGSGERVFEGVPPLDFEVVSVRGTPAVTHVTYRVLR